MSKYTNATLAIANRIVQNYGKYDPYSKCLELERNYISEFDLEKLTASLMIDSMDSASEAMGPDNPSFEKRMLPSLIDFMKNTVDRDNAISFLDEWKRGVLNYFTGSIDELLNDALANFNQEREAA